MHAVAYSLHIDLSKKGLTQDLLYDTHLQSPHASDGLFSPENFELTIMIEKKKYFAQVDVTFTYSTIILF